MMRLPGCLILTLFLHLGCGDDAAVEPDAGTEPMIDAAPGQECDWRSAQGFFSVTSRADYGGFNGVVNDRPTPIRLAEELRMGDCAYYGPSPFFCDPPCDGSVCTADGLCAPWPSIVDGGHLTVTGTSPTLELDPQPGGAYYTTESYPNLYRPGDEITLSAAGDGDVPAFSLTTLGVPELTVPWESQTAVQGQDMVITWDTPGSPPGTVVIVHMDNDHHGIEAYVECISDDTGSVTVAAPVLDLLIEAGASGIGTYIENAWIMRARDATERTGGGCMGFRSESMDFMYVETILENGP